MYEAKEVFQNHDTKTRDWLIFGVCVMNKIFGIHMGVCGMGNKSWEKMYVSYVMFGVEVIDNIKRVNILFVNFIKRLSSSFSEFHLLRI